MGVGLVGLGVGEGVVGVIGVVGVVGVGVDGIDCLLYNKLINKIL